MRIRIVCACGQGFNVDVKHAGKKVKCPGCHQPQRIAAEASAAPVVAAAANGEAGVLARTRHPPLVLIGVIGIFLLLCTLVVGGVGIILYRLNATPDQPVAKHASTRIEQKLPPTVVTQAPQTKVTVSPEEPKETIERKEPSQKDVPKDAFVPLRFRLEEEKGDKKHGGAVEVAEADKASVPYKVRRLKLSDKLDRKRPRLAVTRPTFDNMGRLLDALGDGYRYKMLVEADLTTITRLRQFDVLFLTCRTTLVSALAEWKDDAPLTTGLTPDEVLFLQKLHQHLKEVGEPATPFNPSDKNDIKVQYEFKEMAGGNPYTAAVLRRFVEEGGTLYASDLRFRQVMSAFPEMNVIPWSKPDPFKLTGYEIPGGRFDAEILDPGLRKFLGRDKIDIHLESGGWSPAIFDETKGSLLLRGHSLYSVKIAAYAKGYPLLARFPFKKGTVIFTSFHNSTQNSDIETKLLQYLVFSLTTAGSEARLKELMLTANFTVDDLQLHSFSKEKAGLSKTYTHAGGGLQIAVGFENFGNAKFRLQLQSPQGDLIAHEEPGLYLIEVPAADAGNWNYTVTPLSLPYDNFPVMLGVGKSK